jgi:hypothetical protein
MQQRQKGTRESFLGIYVSSYLTCSLQIRDWCLRGCLDASCLDKVVFVNDNMSA